MSTRWQDKAACVGRTDLDWFADVPTSEVLTLCWSCPVRDVCLFEALRRHEVEDVGVWGGTTVIQRRDLRRGRTSLAKLWPKAKGV